MVNMFEKNQDKLNYSSTDGEIQTFNEWEYINSKISLDSTQNLESGLAFNGGFIEIGNILLKYRNVIMQK